MSDQLEPGVDHADGASDADLVLRSRSGDAEAFGELWTRHYRSGIAAARGISSAIDPDDLVQEAYTKIFQTVKRGGGPTGSFRAYLFTAIRNTAASWGREARDVPIEVADDIEDPDSSEEAAEAALDRGITHSAFRSLPTRWQEVLWYTEIEQLKPREVAPLLGMKPVAVSQLAARAREGLREAWIQAHLANVADGSEHQWAIERLGAHTRGNLAARDRKRLGAHLAECTRCKIVAEEAQHVGSRLAMVLLPLAIGIPAAGAYLAMLQRGEHAAIALVAMPPEVVEGGIAIGGAVVGGGAALASTGSGSGGSSGGAASTGATWTLGGIITAGLATAAIAVAVATGLPGNDNGASSPAAGAFGAGAPGDASIEASDELAEAMDATQSPTPSPSPDLDKDAHQLGITGARVVNAPRGSVAVDITGTPGAVASVHAAGASDPVGAGGSADRPATAAIAAVDGARLDDTTIGANGSGHLAFALSPAQVRADVTLTVLYADSAEPPARATLSALGIRDELLAALDGPAPTPTASSEPTPSPEPEKTTEPAEPSRPAEPSEPTEPSPAPTPTPTPEPQPQPQPSPSPEPTPEPTPTPTPTPDPEPALPSPEPEPAPEPTPEPVPTPEPSAEPTPSPTPDPAPSPSAEPTPEPTATPTPQPSPDPTPSAAPEPTPTPTLTPTPGPTETTEPKPTETPRPTVPPAPELQAPSGVKATLSGQRITITWSEVNDAAGYDVFLQGADASPDELEPVGSTEDPGAQFEVDAPLKPGTYVYLVVATDGERTSAAGRSNEVKVDDVYAPSTPTSLVVNDAGELEWQPSTDYDKRIGYHIYRNGEQITPDAITATTYTDPHNAPGKYTYEVVAVDAAGNKSEKSASAVRSIAPAAPENVTASVGDDGVRVTWNASVGADSYEVSYSTSADGPKTIAPGSPVSGTEAGPIQLAPGTYYFYVTAIGEGGRSSASVSPQVVVPDLVAPTAPTNLTVAADGRLSWAPASDDSGYVEYDVLRAAVPNGASAPQWSTLPDAQGLTTTSFTDEEPLNAGAYLYRVVARDRASLETTSDTDETRYVVKIAQGSYYVNSTKVAYIVLAGPRNQTVDGITLEFFGPTGPMAFLIEPVTFDAQGQSLFPASDGSRPTSGKEFSLPAPLSGGNRIDVKINGALSGTANLSY